MTCEVDFADVRRTLAVVGDNELMALTSALRGVVDRGCAEFPASAAIGDALAVVLAEEVDRRRDVLADAARQLDPGHGRRGRIIAPGQAPDFARQARRELRTAAKAEVTRSERLRWWLSGRWLLRSHRTDRGPAGSAGGDSAPLG